MYNLSPTSQFLDAWCSRWNSPLDMCTNSGELGSLYQPCMCFMTTLRGLQSTLSSGTFEHHESRKCTKNGIGRLNKLIVRLPCGMRTYVLSRHMVLLIAMGCMCSVDKTSRVHDIRNAEHSEVITRAESVFFCPMPNVSLTVSVVGSILRKKWKSICSLIHIQNPALDYIW